MFQIPRIVRLFVLLTLVILIPTFYLFYPSASLRDRSRLDHNGALQAGGIDSEHWRKPITPAVDAYDKEQIRDDNNVVVIDKNDSKDSNSRNQIGIGSSGDSLPLLGIDETVLAGGVIMPKLENATAKAELGRAAWKVLHLITLRFPDEPTPDDRAALKSYFHLFSRLYPCGECAAEFQKLLKEYPPQTSSRKSASLWLCHVHNLVNERLGKPEFDCLTLDATYDCGCGDEASIVAVSASKEIETGIGVAAQNARSTMVASHDGARDNQEMKEDVDMEAGLNMGKNNEERLKRPWSGIGSKAKAVAQAQKEEDWMDD